ncbi:MAG: hypothetical protein OXJ52_03565 [Oligoflexia bacterium]|nr:hypothetical protein [Oligoflexia bacterium]
MNNKTDFLEDFNKLKNSFIQKFEDKRLKSSDMRFATKRPVVALWSKPALVQTGAELVLSLLSSNF